jgi:hypothetical protein
MQVVTIASNKGGVGKTTIACNLAVYLRSLRPEVPVLVIGLDDQSILDRMFAPETPTDAPSIAIAWKRGDLRPAIIPGRHDVHYVPTSSEMGALKRLVSSPYELSRLLSFAPWDGLVVIDTKGDLEILTQNAIAASDLTVLVASDYSAVVEAEKVRAGAAVARRPAREVPRGRGWGRARRTAQRDPSPRATALRDVHLAQPQGRGAVHEPLRDPSECAHRCELLRESPSWKATWSSCCPRRKTIPLPRKAPFPRSATDDAPPGARPGGPWRRPPRSCSPPAWPCSRTSDRAP